MTDFWSCQVWFSVSSDHRLRTPREEIAFTARPKVQSQSQIFRYGGSIFCLPHRPNLSDIFDLCLHWVSVVRAHDHTIEFQSTFSENSRFLEFPLGNLETRSKKWSIHVSKFETLEPVLYLQYILIWLLQLAIFSDSKSAGSECHPSMLITSSRFFYCHCVRGAPLSG